MITTQKQIRSSFWESHPGLERRKIRVLGNWVPYYPTDTRCAFVDYVEHLCRSGQISVSLAGRVTL